VSDEHVIALAVVGSLGALALGLALAGAVQHVAWWLADEGRRRRARRRHGYLSTGGVR